MKKSLKLYGDTATAVMTQEMQILNERGVYEPVHCDKLTKAQRQALIRSSLFVKENFKPNGVFDRLRARLVAGGTQQNKILYTIEDTSSPNVIPPMYYCLWLLLPTKDVISLLLILYLHT